MLQLALDLGAVMLLPAVGLAGVVWAIVGSERQARGGRPPHEPGAAATAERDRWVAAEAARGIRDLEAHLARAAVRRRP